MSNAIDYYSLPQLLEEEGRLRNAFSEGRITTQQYRQQMDLVIEAKRRRVTDGTNAIKKAQKEKNKMNINAQHTNVQYDQNPFLGAQIGAQNASLGAIGLGGAGGLLQYSTPVAFQKSVTQKKEGTMGFVKEYFSKHRELFMGLAIAIILDRYLLGGAFQDRLKKIITGLLDKTEGALALEKKA